MIKGYTASTVNINEVAAMFSTEVQDHLDGIGLGKTPHELRRELQRERRTATKERDLDRRTKRKNKRSQAY